MKNAQEYILIMLVIGAIMLVGNFVGYQANLILSLGGMLVLIFIVFMGELLHKTIPIKIPAVAYISIIGIIASLPGTPWGNFVIDTTAEIQLLAIATPILAYAGIAIGRSWTDFKKLGWRALIVCTLVLFGTLIGSTIVAEIILRLQGII